MGVRERGDNGRDQGPARGRADGVGVQSQTDNPKKKHDDSGYDGVPTCRRGRTLHAHARLVCLPRWEREERACACVKERLRQKAVRGPIERFSNGEMCMMCAPPSRAASLPLFAAP